MRVEASAAPVGGNGSKASSRLTPVIFRLPVAMLRQIDAFGGNRFIHRSERMRALLAAGLKSES